ncbi:DUF6526 family protein [Pedobacter mucosus]|uniref:DUF6526 family protein n=1 Tax=Pedobacter mucosus TaxID=2895286 RepID=UPI001EE4D6F5|nr:DUF6526 family protein [Pedobacter mucosus]UKT65651.1 DUF6526 family protein [Pedobacter mucosus]
MIQNYSNHKRFFPLFHFITVPLTLAGLILAVYAFFSISTIITGLIVLAFILILFTALMARMFALKAQDRAARAEEKLRYYILAGKTFPTNLEIGQILALRFAGDDEYLALIDRTLAEQLSPNDIKKSIKNWKSDFHRV